jgi:hypothetical protein
LWSIRGNPRRSESSAEYGSPYLSWASLPKGQPVRSLPPEYFGSRKCNISHVEIVPEGQSSLGCLRKSSIKINGRFRPLIDSSAVEKTWQPSVLGEDQPEIFPCPRAHDLLDPIWSVNTTDGRILLARKHRYEHVLVQTDSKQMPPVEDSVCLEILERGFLALQCTKNNSVFRSVGCGSHKDSKGFQ